jgi:hypothetical protein
VLLSWVAGFYQGRACYLVHKLWQDVADIQSSVKAWLKDTTLFTICTPPLQPILPEPDTATVWLTWDGTILNVCPAFTDWFAFTAKVGGTKRPPRDWACKMGAGNASKAQSQEWQL